MSENLDEYILKRQKDCQAGYDGFVKMGAWDGWYRWISSFYPDEAHFVFELLQNAEDAKATKVKFELGNDNLLQQPLKSHFRKLHQRHHLRYPKILRRQLIPFQFL